VEPIDGGLEVRAFAEPDRVIGRLPGFSSKGKPGSRRIEASFDGGPKSLPLDTG
jgi:hypothetical protein